MTVVLEMRIRVQVEPEDLAERKAELRRRVADLDPDPRFITAEAWLVEAQEETPRQIRMPGFVGEAEHTGRLRL